MSMRAASTGLVLLTVLQGVPAPPQLPRDDGQWRLSLARWRFRYDVAGREVLLKRCGLRREDTYRKR